MVGDEPAVTQDNLKGIGTVVLVDRAIRATVHRFDLFLEPAIVAEWLERGPDVDTDGIVAWGRLTSEQILSLLDLSGDEDGRDVWSEIVATHESRDLFISAVWRRRP